MKLFLVEYGIVVANIKKYVIADDEADIHKHDEITNHFSRKVTHLPSLNRIDPDPLIDLKKVKGAGTDQQGQSVYNETG